MQHKSIDVSKAIKTILPETLEKDLCDDEAICSVCHGLGVVTDNNVYGIEGDTSEAAKKSMFLYNHQSLRLCPNCFNGVVKLCKYCGKPLRKGTTECDCPDYQTKKEVQAELYFVEKLCKATEVNDEDVNTWLYDEDTDTYYSDIQDFISVNANFADYNTLDKLMVSLPKILWLTETTQIYLNADEIISDACEELHEDAFDTISEYDKKALQKSLDDWCKKQTGTTTYIPDDTRYVRVKREWFKKVE